MCQKNGKCQGYCQQMSFDKLFHNYLHFCVVFGVCQVCGCRADTNLGLNILIFNLISFTINDSVGSYVAENIP